MRAVIQRVDEASVTVEDNLAGKIGPGLLILAGFEENDTPEDIRWLSKKIVQLRIFNDAQELMNLSVQDTGGDVLVVSQFTLHALTQRGNRPSFIKAAKPEIAKVLFEQFKEQLARDLGKQVSSGIFGAMMKIQLVNNGPVTIFIDTKNKE